MNTLYAADIASLENYLETRKTLTEEKIKLISDSPVCEMKFSLAPPGSERAISDIYSVNGDTAHIRISGILNRAGADIIDFILGNEVTSYETIIGAIKKAKLDETIKSVVLEISSPGGELAGVDETWQELYSLSAVKNTTAIGKDLVASAAYWIASAAKSIKATSPTDRFGSIGLQILYYDDTVALEKEGIREYKIVSKNAPLKNATPETIEGRNTIREQLNALERIFYAHISESRGVSTEHIAEHFGRGGLLVAQDPSSEHEDAIRAGMIDGLTTDTAQTAAEKTENAPRVITSAEIINKIESFSYNELERLIAFLEQAEEAAALIAEQKDTPLTKAEVDALLAKYSPSGDTNTPAPAGTTQEGQTMNLSEFLPANPAAAAEIDKLKSEAKEAGAKEAKAELSARVDKVLPIIQSAAYPANIKTLACNVLAGKEEMSAFTATVTMFDTNAEAANSQAAQAHTQELGAVTAEAPSLTPAAEKELDAAFKAELEKRKVK